MYSLLLAIIYFAFISLGLPDSLLGSAWPVMMEQLNVPLSYAGIVSMIIAGGTIVTSLLSDALTKKFGTGPVVAFSVLLTAAAIFGFSVSSGFWLLCVLAVPYGLGAGAIDAALNNYVALRYAARHMSWLHCFWGVGASISPFIMGYSLTNGMGWNNGYRIVAIIQIILTAILFVSLPLWKGNPNGEAVPGDRTDTPPLKLSRIIKIKGVKFVLAAFFAYCALESIAGLWASSFLVTQKGVDTETAAICASLFFLGITFGRFVSGFIFDKASDEFMIIYGIIMIFIGIIAIWFPVQNWFLCICGLVMVGWGCAPIYPAIIHSTPKNFGKENSQAVIGVQMASAYTGTTFMPPLFGFFARNFGIGLYPAFLLIFTVLMLFMIKKLNKALALKEKEM